WLECPYSSRTGVRVQVWSLPHDDDGRLILCEEAGAVVAEAQVVAKWDTAAADLVEGDGGGDDGRAAFAERRRAGHGGHVRAVLGAGSSPGADCGHGAHVVPFPLSRISSVMLRNGR